MEKKIILYVDRWTKGIHNFAFFDEELRKEGYDTMLLHYSSLYGFAGPTEERKSGILCRDLKYYKTKRIDKAIKIIRPAIIILLTTVYIQDRIIHKIAKHFRIKTVYFQHGDRPIGNEIAMYTEMKKKIAKSIWDKISSYKYIVLNYFICLALYDKKKIFNGYFFSVLFNILVNSKYAYLYPKPHDDLIFDVAMIYSQRYQEYLMENGYNQKQIKIVGNPNLDRVIKEIKSINYITPSKPKEINTLKKYCLYLENSYAAIGVWDYDYLNYHLEKIKLRVNKLGYDLVVKLHPLSKIDKLKISGITFLKDVDALALTYFCDFCIVHSSSINNYPILLNKPIIFPKMGKI